MAVEVPAAGLSLSESHPLSEELSSLRALVAHFQVCIIVHCLSFFWRGSRETVFVLLERGRTVTVLVSFFCQRRLFIHSLMLNYLYFTNLN
jgi:hypothetical protein